MPTKDQISFYTAVKSGDETASLAALEKVKDLNFAIKGGAYGTTHEPIHLVAKKGMTKVLLKMHEKGFSIDTADGHCRNILLIAQEAGQIAFAEAAFAINPKHCLKHDINHITALHIAASKNQLSLLQMFLNQGMAINCVDGLRRRTPLHYAAKEGHTEMVALLLNNGARAKIFDLDNILPRHLCPISNHALNSLLKEHENDISLFERCALVIADFPKTKINLIPECVTHQQKALVAFHQTQQVEYEKNKVRLKQEHEHAIKHIEQEFPGFITQVDSLRIT